MGTLDPAKTVLRYPWIWGWIQQKPFFRPPGSGGGSSKNFGKILRKRVRPPFSGPLQLLKYPFSTPFSVPLQLLKCSQYPLFQYPCHTFTLTVIQSRFSTLPSQHAKLLSAKCFQHHFVWVLKRKKLDRRESHSPRYHRVSKHNLFYIKKQSPTDQSTGRIRPTMLKNGCHSNGINGELFEISL